MIDFKYSISVISKSTMKTNNQIVKLIFKKNMAYYYTIPGEERKDLPIFSYCYSESKYLLDKFLSELPYETKIFEYTVKRNIVLLKTVWIKNTEGLWDMEYRYSKTNIDED